MSRTPKNGKGSPERRLFMVELKVDMPDTPTYTFFGSKKAIFEYFGNKALRLSYAHSRNINFAQPYENAVCRIIEGALYSLTSSAVIERREREGREPIPASNLKGARSFNDNNEG